MCICKSLADIVKSSNLIFCHCSVTPKQIGRQFDFDYKSNK